MTKWSLQGTEYLCRKLKEEYQNCGLTLNMDKTKQLCVGDPTEDLQLDEGIKVQACEEYVYLGMKWDKSGSCKR
jgi:histidinol phosphatase-like enzyme